MDKVKPCPFCGCEMVIKPVLMCDNRTIRYMPRAHGRHKRGCALEFASFIGYPTKEKSAIEKWNRRVGNE